MIRKQVNWLIENMDRKHRRQMVLALGICVVSCVLLLVNPALSKRLIDDVIMAQNAEPLIPILCDDLPVHGGLEADADSVCDYAGAAGDQQDAAETAV